MYIIVRTKDGRFVTRPGSRASYTAYLQDARTFSTREQAERETCGNERVIRLEEAMGT